MSYPSLRRFIIKRNWRRRSKTTVRMADTPPGEVAEADFGRLDMVTDPATGVRKAVWAIVIVTCHFRHCFVWPMRQHMLPVVIAGLGAAWAFSGGMPKYLVATGIFGARPNRRGAVTPTLTLTSPAMPSLTNPAAFLLSIRSDRGFGVIRATCLGVNKCDARNFRAPTSHTCRTSCKEVSAMLLPYRKATLPAASFRNSSGAWSGKARWRAPITSSLIVALLLAIATTIPSSAALAHDVPGDMHIRPGVEGYNPAAAMVDNDGRSSPASGESIDHETIWSGTLSVQAFPEAPDFYGYSIYHSVGELDRTSFLADGRAYTVTVMALSPIGNALGLRLIPDLYPEDASGWTLLVDGAELPLTHQSVGPDYEDNETLLLWQNSGLSWADGQEVSVQLIR